VKERFQSIEDKTARLREILSRKRPAVQDFLDRFEMAWVYHDCALEGSVYTSPELSAALHPGAVVAEASLLPIVWEIRNHKAALDYMRSEAGASKKNSPLSMTFVRHLHDLLSGATPEAQAARAQAERRERTEKELAKERDKQGFRKEIPLHKTYLHDIAQPSKVQPMLEKLVDWTTSSEFRELHPILQSARLQHQFIQIFPFADTSGKIGRFLTNFILVRSGFFPAVIVSVDRSKYFGSFRSSFSVFSNLIIDAVENSTDNALKHFSDLARTYR
jgi:Fic family protein